jgi:CBS-domain-containing membrane protein
MSFPDFSPEDQDLNDLDNLSEELSTSSVMTRSSLSGDESNDYCDESRTLISEPDQKDLMLIDDPSAIVTTVQNTEENESIEKMIESASSYLVTSKKKILELVSLILLTSRIYSN